MTRRGTDDIRKKRKDRKPEEETYKVRVELVARDGVRVRETAKKAGVRVRIVKSKGVLP